MNNNELKALVSLLEDDDNEVVFHVEEQIRAFGTAVIPFLEEQWESQFNPVLQQRIEDLIHDLQFELVKERLVDWYKTTPDDLLRGLWILATYQYPDLDFEELQTEVEQIHYEIWPQFKDDLTPFDQVRIMNNVMFDRLKFRANTKNFHSPANSMINMVLESRKGNPISLSAIYMILAQKLGMPVYGVNLPNLFILTYKQAGLQFYINVFNKGLIFSKDDIDNYIAHLQLERLEIFYQPCEPIDIVKRFMRNLIVSFEKVGEYHRSDEVKSILLLFDDKPF